jgi:hypothetical protein
MATKLKNVGEVLVRNYIAGVNTFMSGKPALGKTTVIEAFCDKMKARMPEFESWKFYVPTMSPMDIQASAPNYETGMLTLYNNAALPNAYMTPDAKGVLFLGELPNADPATAKLLQKYVNGEDMSGVLRKPDGVIVIADGNRLEDKSSVQQQGRAFMSRFEQIDVYSDANDNLAYALANNWHPNVTTFFKDHPSLIDNYDEVFSTGNAASTTPNQKLAAATSEEAKRGIWANMRSWERVSKKEFAADTLSTTTKANVVTRDELIGNLGMGVAMQYDAHKTILSKLTSYDDIVKDPSGAPLPTKTDEIYMMAMLLAMKAKPDMSDFKSIRIYTQRMPLEFQAVVLRQMSSRGKQGYNPANGDGYIQWIVQPELNSLIVGK